jgi:L-iditol 2-dehydrogenase
MAPGKLEIQNVDIPVPGPGELLVKIRVATTCGTDVKTYRRGHPKVEPPTPFGHEFAGDVVSVGKGVKEFKVGMRVVAHNTAPCGTCYYCIHHQESMCENLILNIGTYSEYIVVPALIVEINTFEIPQELSYSQAVMLEPFSTVVHGQEIINIQPGENVAIIGSGPIGLMHLQMALYRGASLIIVSDLSDERLKVTKKIGGDRVHILNPNHSDPLEKIRELTGGRGVDVAIESAGAASAWQTALAAARPGGRVLWFGGLPSGTQVEIDSYAVHYGELSMYGIFHCTPLDVYHAFQLISSGVLDTESLITGELPLEKVEDAFKMMMAGECIKMAIIPDM